MKRKLLNGLLLASALIGVGTFQSCKDYEADYQNEWNQENLSLQDQLNILNNRVGELEYLQAQCQKQCREELAKILRELGLKADKADLVTLENTVDLLDSRIQWLLEHRTDGQLSKDDVRELIYKVLIENGWPTDENGKITKVDLAQMQEVINNHASSLATLYATTNTLETQIASLKTNWSDLDARVTAIEAQLRALKPANNWTEEQIRKMAQEEAERLFGAEITQLKVTLSNLQLTVNQNTEAIDALSTLLSKFDVRLTKAEQDAITALTKAEENADAIFLMQYVTIPAIEASVKTLEENQALQQEDINNLKVDVIMLSSWVSDIEEKYNELNTLFSDLVDDFHQLDIVVGQMNDRVIENRTDIDILLEYVTTLASQEALDKLTSRVADNESAIQALQGDMMKVLKIYDRLNSMVTGIILEGTFNNLFGTFSLPIGVKNNMLVNYYGYYDGLRDLKFPSVTTSSTNEMLTPEEASLLAGLYTPEVITNGEYLMDGNLGKVYLTINPSNVDLSGVTLDLVKSSGAEASVQLKNVQKSSHELDFNVTRAENGFYEADAVLPLSAAAINATKVEASEGLKTSIKDVLKDRSKSSVFSLLRGVYDQISSGLPAYAIKHSWTVDDGMGAKSYSVLSGYEMALVTFKPLSFNTYAGQSIDKKFKHHGPIKSVQDMLDDLINNDRFHFSISTKVKVDGSQVQYKFHLKEIHLSYDGEIYAETSGIDIYDENGQYVGKTGTIKIPVASKDMDSFLDDLSYQFNNDILPEWNAQMKESFDNAVADLCNQVDTEVSRALEDLEGSINEQIDKIINDMKNDIAGKTQRFVDKFNDFLEKYNKVVDKANKFLSDPNHYLQVAMVYYAGNGKLELVSDDVNDPTVLKNNGGTGATLFASTYTAEIAAPAYKKFVAITAGWDNKGNKLSANEIKALNKQGALCKVLPGRSKRVALQTSSMKKGYKYEILYTALDFHGYTSTNHYYVTIK